uniref:G-protein coupled receptors family 2 profile 1 domain-containing protein n=1 Tax=Sinocyclocheilus anshuiensis TaxID=1608454 RepID=A0A671REK6_9TELE
RIYRYLLLVLNSCLFCSRFWDGLLCWDETPAGTFASQNCPDYPSFDPLGKILFYLEAQKCIS